MEGGPQSLAPNPTVDSGLRPSQNEALPTQAITLSSKKPGQNFCKDDLLEIIYLGTKMSSLEKERVNDVEI